MTLNFWQSGSLASLKKKKAWYKIPKILCKIHKIYQR